MTAPVPASVISPGIHIGGVYLVTCEFEDLGFQQLLQGHALPGEGHTTMVDFTPTVAVYTTADQQAAIVLFGMNVRTRSEFGYRAQVTYVAQLTATEDAQVNLITYAWNSGVMTLVPFVRERLASVTAISRYGPFLLPPLNVQAMLEQLRANATNAGTQPAGDAHSHTGQQAGTPAGRSAEAGASRKKRPKG